MERRIPLVFTIVILFLLFRLAEQENAGNCNFDSTTEKFCSWRQENNDDQFDWTLQKGSTPSGSTGPSKDHSGKGYYAYIETSSPRRENDNAKIRNGPFSGKKCLHFYYSMIGDTIGSLLIHQHIHGQYLDVWSKSGEQPSSEWHYDNVTVHGNNYYIIFEGIAGSGFTGDIAIDDIYFTEGSCNVSDDTGGKSSPQFVFGNSNYTFHKSSAALKRNWTKSRQRCKDSGSELVSIESEKEWNFLKNTIQRMETDEYFIGLKKDSKSGEWKWISDNSKVNATIGKFPWAKYEPSGVGNCAVMYKNYNYYYGLFNDLRCTAKRDNVGYICESPVDSNDQEVPTVGKTSARTEGEATTKTTLRQSLAVTSAAPLTPYKNLSTEAPSKEATPQTERGNKESGTNPTMRQLTSSKYFLTEWNSEATPPKDVKEVPIEDTTKTNTKVIVIVLTLLALLILITLIVFYVMYVRRRNFKKQVQSRVRCTYKKPSSPGQQSVEHGQQLESSATEVTVHVTLSRSNRCLDTYEIIGDQEGPAYANVKQINRKSETHREESLTHEDKTAEQTKSEDGHCMPLKSSPLDATNKLQAHGVADVKTAEKQENKDHVYAIVHKDTQCRDSAGSVHARTLCSKRLETASPACSAVKPVNRSFIVDPADHSDARPCSVELVNNLQEALVQDEKKDYLYAVVDKANKKKRPPQKPSPYRGLVYADLNHATTSNTGPVKREFPTVYADIDYATTDRACSKLPEEHLDQTTECTE